MTRGTLALAHGDLFGSLALNPGVVAALVAAVVLAVVLWRRPRLSMPSWLPFAVVAGLWSFQLLKFATARPL
jgi:hypothetical protein